MKSQLFIFSLPRSGSTFLQSLLGRHKAIATVSEPWILLPHVFMQKKEGLMSKYSHELAFQAMEDFQSELGKEKYKENLKDFLIKNYSDLCKNGEDYFLDKTPRYYLIIDEIRELFPDAKFIFLTRDLIDVYSSIHASFHENRYLTAFKSKIDLYEGPNLLYEAYKKYKNESILLKYEDLKSNTEFELKRIINYLALDYEDDLLSELGETKLEGRMGDKKSLMRKDSTKFDLFLNSSFRKRKIKEYIEKVDKGYFNLFDYSKAAMKERIEKKSFRFNPAGIFRDFIEYKISQKYVKKRMIFSHKNYLWTKDVEIS